ncbi:hypothetical protein [Eubacterium barkeri]|nr:hypothetical protein [Eubacterium barkeri]
MKSMDVAQRAGLIYDVDNPGLFSIGRVIGQWPIEDWLWDDVDLSKRFN